MELVISIKEKPAGFLSTQIRASGAATKLEADMTTRLAMAVNKALQEFDREWPGASGGTGLRIMERELPKD